MEPRAERARRRTSSAPSRKRTVLSACKSTPSCSPRLASVRRRSRRIADAGLDRLSLRDIPKLRLLLDREGPLAPRAGRRRRRSAHPRRAVAAAQLERGSRPGAGRPAARRDDLREPGRAAAHPGLREVAPRPHYPRVKAQRRVPLSHRRRLPAALRFARAEADAPCGPRTWHTTLLAEVGEARNKEGPLPWIERDYTPISTAHDWENGRCDILIKIYLEPWLHRHTEWLHRVPAAAVARAPEVAMETDGDAGGAGSRGVAFETHEDAARAELGARR